MADTLATMLTKYMQNKPVFFDYSPRHGNTKDPIHKKAPTGGEWTKKIGYNPKRREMTINFQSGFQATYPNIDENTFLSAKRGATTQDGRPNSVGAWLHQNSEVMKFYKESPINMGKKNFEYNW